MTFNLSAKQLKRRSGPVKGHGVGAVVKEGEGDRAQERGLCSLLGEAPRPVAVQEAAAVRVPLPGEQIPPALPTQDTRSDTMTPIPFASTYLGNRRRGRGVKRKRRE